MKVVLNLTCINNTPSGARNRISHLYYFLIKNNPNIKFFILEPKDSNIQNLFFDCNNVNYVKTKCLSYHGVQRYIVGLITIPKIIKKINPDIYEQFHLPLIKIKNVKTIFTIHDIRYSSHLKNFFRPRFISNYFIKKSILNSTKVFTVSKAVKNELKKFVKYDNIEYIYNVLNFDLFDIKSNNITKSKHFNDKYILSIGVIESRKNYKTLINSAFLVKKIFPKIKFIIIGSKTSYISKLYDLIKLLNLENNIIFLHSVTDEELLQYYLKSSLFLFPSEYEGFGIPVLEAIRSKCKILLSDLNVFKELTENKVSYFNRYSSEDLAYHILNSLNSNSYFDENYFLDQEILENFHVEKVSNKIIKVYNSCVA